jgi:hypothetical protein
LERIQETHSEGVRCEVVMKVIFKRLEDINPYESPGVIDEMRYLFDGVTERNVELSKGYDGHYLYEDYLINKKWFTKVNDFDEIMKMFEL